jgi:hypothetical protein
MEFFTINERAKIATIIKYMVSEGMDVEVEIQGADERFTTRAIGIKEFFETDCLIVDKLSPEEGNVIIQSAPDLIFYFDVQGRLATFPTKYLGMDNEHPHYGLIMEFPSALHLEEQRREQRIIHGLAEILSVEFSLEDDDKQYQLSVDNIGPSGIGLIVEKKDFDLFKKIDVGGEILDIRFFLPMATLTIDAMVKHMTLIKEGQFRGCYLVGIETRSLLELKELQEEIEKMQ